MNKLTQVPLTITLHPDSTSQKTVAIIKGALLIRDYAAWLERNSLKTFKGELDICYDNFKFLDIDGIIKERNGGYILIATVNNKGVFKPYIDTDYELTKYSVENNYYRCILSEWKINLSLDSENNLIGTGYPK